jgi:hypothetical protein
MPSSKSTFIVSTMSFSFLIRTGGGHDHLGQLEDIPTDTVAAKEEEQEDNDSVAAVQGIVAGNFLLGALVLPLCSRNSMQIDSHKRTVWAGPLFLFGLPDDLQHFLDEKQGQPQCSLAYTE